MHSTDWLHPLRRWWTGPNTHIPATHYKQCHARTIKPKLPTTHLTSLWVVIREHVPRLLCFIFCGRRRKPFNLHSDSKWIFYCFGELDGRGLCAVPPTKKPRRHNGRLCTDEHRLTWPLPTTHKQDISWMSNNIMHTQSVLNTSSSSHIPNSNCKGTQETGWGGGGGWHWYLSSCESEWIEMFCGGKKLISQMSTECKTF